MKKYVSVLIMTSLLLTGCGNAAGTAEGSTPAAESPVSSSESAEESASDSQEDEEPAKSTSYKWQGIEMPIPAGMEIDNVAKNKSYMLWTGGTESDPVYYGFSSDYFSPDITRTDDDALEKSADVLYDSINQFISVYYYSKTATNQKALTSSEETTFLDYPALREEGTITTEDNVKLNYVAYYFVLDYTDGGYPDLPSFWISFTPSDDPKALETMKNAADAPLTEAKPYTY